MNQKLTSAIASLNDKLEAADSPEAIQSVLVDYGNTALKSNLEDSQNNSGGEVTSREYLVGEANTRGLSWKLNLLRQCAQVNFCQMVRLGVHGGSVRIIGTEENINATFALYDALVPRYEEVSKKAFQDFSDQQGKEEGGKAPHRVGWVNQYLIETPNSAFGAVQEARGSNPRVDAMLAQNEERFKEVRASFAPARAEKAPKAAKAPKAPKAAKGGETVEAETPATPETASASAD